MLFLGLPPAQTRAMGYHPLDSMITKLFKRQRV